MRIAIVFDDLIQFGGAEKLLLAALEIWPDATLFTTVISKDWGKICIQKNVKLQTSFMQRIPFCVRLNRVLGALLLHPLAFRTFNFNSFDLVLSISSRFSHLIITKPSTLHIAYINSPARMFWEPFSYFDQDKVTSFGVIGNALKVVLLFPQSLFRIYDYSMVKSIDYVIANSKTPQKRIHKYYKKEAAIINPFVELPSSTDFPNASSSKNEKEEYYIVISRLVAWKKIEIAIEACEALNKKLIVVGSGPDLERLKKHSGKNTTFLGYVSDDEKVNLLYGATALLVTQYEDFGITPIEAMSLGVPVIAYGKGGVTETVVAGSTGEFFEPQSSEALRLIMQGFNSTKYKKETCVQRSSLYSKDIFVSKMKEFINSVYLDNH